MAATYKLDVNKLEVVEGDTIIVTLTTTGVAPNTRVYWEMFGTNIDPYDLLPRTLKGRFVTNESNIVSYTFKIDPDWKIEDTEYLTFRLKHFPTEKIVITIAGNVVVIPKETTLTINRTIGLEGDTILLQLQTQGYPANTEFPWVIKNLDQAKRIGSDFLIHSSQIVPNATAGIFVINSNGFSSYTFNVSKAVTDTFIDFVVPSLALSKRLTFFKEASYQLSFDRYVYKCKVGDKVKINLFTFNVKYGTQIEWTFSSGQSNNLRPAGQNGFFELDVFGIAQYEFEIQRTEGVLNYDFKLRFLPANTLSFYIDKEGVAPPPPPPIIPPPVIVPPTREPDKEIIIDSDRSYVNLLTLFKEKYGNPTKTTNSVFIIESNVKIISESPDNPSIYGDIWPEGSTRLIRILSGAKIIGRGGQGGQAADINSNVASKSGGNGGTAIKAENGSSITVENQGFIAGGGGGGGASPNIGYIEANVALALVTGGSGGAPYGKSGALSKNTLFAIGGSTSRLQYYSENIRYRWHFSDPSPASGYWVRTIGENRVGNYTEYREAPRPYDDATFDTTVTPFTMVAYEPTPNFWHKGGKGGNIGLDGESGSGSGENAKHRYYVTEGLGGKAGFISQGPVTISNTSGGQVKGRTV